MPNEYDDHVVARYCAEGIWTSTSAFHTGGELEESLSDVDKPMLRDPDGTFKIPGSTVADVARAYLGKRRMGADYYQPRTKEAPEDPLVSLLFGNQFMSPLIVYHAKQTNNVQSVHRDGVKIDGATS